ncbi:TPA: autotransporter outer membrane beta-barrel domain-containing protein, partial [Shigella boydii]
QRKAPDSNVTGELRNSISGKGIVSATARTDVELDGDNSRFGVKTYLNSHHQRDDGKQREFQPYIEANWINNSKVYAVKMNGQTVGREGARNLGEVRTGVEAKVNNNLSLWGNVGVQLGDKGYSDTQGMLGVKFTFICEI